MKKFTLAILAIFILVCFTCCGKAEQVPTSAVTTDDTTEAATTEATEDQDEAFSDSDSFKIGLILTEDDQGTKSKKGIQTAVNKINKSGEYKFEIVDTYNDKNTYTYNDLLSEGVQFLISNTDNIIPAQEKPKNILHISLNDLSDKNTDNILSLNDSSITPGKRIADYVSAKFPTEKIGTIYNSDSQSYTEQTENFHLGIQQSKIQLAFSEGFSNKNAYDFTSQLIKAYNSDVKALVLFASKDNCALIIEQADAMGYRPDFIGGEQLKGLITLDNVNKKYISNTHIVTEFSTNAQTSAEFVSLYKTAYGEKPDIDSALGYDSVYVIYEALKNAQIKKYSYSGEKLLKKINDKRDDFTFIGITGESIKWDSNGKISRVSPSILIEKGKYVK